MILFDEFQTSIFTISTTITATSLNAIREKATFDYTFNYPGQRCTTGNSRIQWGKSGQFPAGLLLSFPRDFRRFPAGYGDFPCIFPAGSS